MKNSPKNNNSEKNSKQYKKNSNSFPKIDNSTKKNDRFLINSSKHKSSKYLSGSDKNQRNFSSLKRRNPIDKSKKDFYFKSPDVYQEFANKKILMIGFGENIQFLKHLIVKELLTEFGAHQKFFLQRNSIFYSKNLNQMVSSLRKSHGTGFLN